jgi:hypothetical protein
VTIYYAPRETYVLGPSGDYLSGPDLQECSECGALVGDTDKHTAWHAPPRCPDHGGLLPCAECQGF